MKKGSEDLRYEVKYSSRKTLALCVKEGQLIVRAPIGVPCETIEKAISSHMPWIEKQMDRQAAKRELMSGISDAKIAELKKQAKNVLKTKTEYFSRIMNLKYGRITITSAKTRFGSCSSKGNISYSYRLMLYPEEAIDYVVVHELAHLREMNHSKRFYAIIESVLPDYKSRKKLLK